MSSLSLSLVQTGLYWQDKAANLEMLEKKIMSIAPGTELIILPEMFSTGFTMSPSAFAETMDGATVGWMRKMAAQKNAVITGSIIIKDDQDNYYNRLIWMSPDGKYSYYNKRHLFSYAGEDGKYTPGEDRLIVSLKDWKINLQVCYDLRFPVWARSQVSINDNGGPISPEYDLLVYVANWPERRIVAWEKLLQARAIENQVYVAGVNRTGNDGNNIYHNGNSLLIDPLGNILYQKKDEEDIFTTTLFKEEIERIRNKYPFWKDGDAFEIR